MRDIDLSAPAMAGISRREDGKLVTHAGYVLPNDTIAAIASGKLWCENTPECRLCGPVRCLFRDWPADLAWPDGTR